MKTWKKIEDTRKRTNEIVSLKNRNEERLRQVSLFLIWFAIERTWISRKIRDGALLINLELYDLKAAGWRKKKSLKGNLSVKDWGSKAN